MGSWAPYIISLAVGLGVGILYGLINVRSPAPPIIALLGLLGMLIGESVVAYFRGHQEVTAECLHSKSFSVAEAPEASLDGGARP